jgi:polygalacturonase
LRCIQIVPHILYLMNYINRQRKTSILTVTLYALLALVPAFTQAQGKRYNIQAAGAKGDNKTVNTDAINKTITQCFKAGGGTVVVPKGVYLTATIYLKSKVNLLLSKGAVLKGVADANLYRSFIPKTDLSKYSTVSDEGNNGNSAYDTVWTKALIIGQGANHISISGEGTIDGEHVFNPKGEENMRGPHTIILANCTGVKFENLTIKKAANYAILAYNLQDVVFSKVRIRQGWDGIHIRGGKNVLLQGCDLQTGDDAIAGGFWDNFKVQNCSINSACNGIRVIMPVKGFTVTHCLFAGPGKFAHRTSGKLHRTNMLAGIYIQPGGWGLAKGDIEGVHFSNLKMRNMDNPFIFELHKGNNAQDITVENIVADSIKRCIAVNAAPGFSYQSVTFKNLHVNYATNATSEAPWALGAMNVQHLRLENVKFYATGVKPTFAVKLDNVKFPALVNTNVYSADHTQEVRVMNSGVIEVK